ncbi:MAG: DUF3078 domain-containing protein [Cyclobacteriaceae bacterium]
MKKNILLFFIFIAASYTAEAQRGQIDTLIFKYVPPADTVKYWSTGGAISMNIRSVFLTDWTKGGNSNISLGSNLNLFANKKKNRHTIDLKLDAGFGIMREGDANYKFKKNNDFIIFIGKYSEQVIKKWYLTGMLDTRTQFAKGYRYFMQAGEEQRELRSNFLSPITLLPSLGFSLKEKAFSVTVSPISGKFTIYNNDSLARLANLPPGQNVLSEAGPSLSISDKRTIFKESEIRYNILMFSRFSRVVYHWDIQGELYMRFKVHKYVSLIYTHLLIYDDANKLRRDDDTSYVPWQQNQMINIGFTMDIFSKEK